MSMSWEDINTYEVRPKEFIHLLLDLIILK